MRKSEGLLSILAPIMAVVFAAFLVVGAAMPVLPIYVAGSLSLGSVWVGAVDGSQFMASLASGAGVPAVFLTGGVMSLAALPIASHLRRAALTRKVNHS